ncbi:MAG: recombination protein RecR [Alphaproteobacteria bacterium]|nr:MAG: recombination protein RecR [Alphaproteobacteria bacterium]
MALIPLPLERLLRQLGKLPGLGPRSAQRVALALLQQPTQLGDLQRNLADVAAQLGICTCCGNLAFAGGNAPVCEICTDPLRNTGVICVVEGIADVWALERSGVFNGRYHVLGGVVSALNGVGPEDVHLPQLVKRVHEESVSEVILALGASVDGQTTGQIIMDRVAATGVAVSTLAKGMPVGAAVDYLDEGTLSLALAGRQRVA